MPRAATDGSRGQHRTVPAVDRAARILQALAAADLRLTDLARDLHLPKSTTFEILRTLRTHRFVAVDPHSGRFRLGPALPGLGARVQTRADLREAARPVLLRLARATGETTILHIPDEDGYLILDREESPHQLRVAAPIGLRLPPFAGAVAKAILASVPEREAAQRIPRRLPQFTVESITGRAVYLRDLGRTRTRGYATDDEEYLPGVRAVSAPIAGADGRVVATLSIVGVKTRVSAVRWGRAGRLVKAGAREISDVLRGDQEWGAGRASHG